MEYRTTDDRAIFDNIIKVSLRRKERHSVAKEFEALVNLEERLDANLKGLIGEAITNFKSEVNTEYNNDVKEIVKKYLKSCNVFNK